MCLPLEGEGGGMERKGCRFFWNNLSNQPRMLANVTHLFTTTYWIIHHKLTHGCTKKNRLKNTVLKGKAHNKTYHLCSCTFFSFFFQLSQLSFILFYYFIALSKQEHKHDIGLLGRAIVALRTTSNNSLRTADVFPVVEKCRFNFKSLN